MTDRISPASNPCQRKVHTTIAILALLIATTISAGGTPANLIGLRDSADSLEIARCHFDEGRIVVRHKEKLHVLRDGEWLEVAGLHVVSITPEAATLAIRERPPAEGLRIIRITDAGFGRFLVREFATDPAALAAGSPTDAPQATVSITHAEAPESSSNGD